MRIKLTYGRGDLWIDFHESNSVSVAHVLYSVRDQHPDVYKRWSDLEGHLRPSLTVYVNGQHIRYRQGMETKLSDGDEVYVVPIVAGG